MEIIDMVEGPEGVFSVKAEGWPSGQVHHFHGDHDHIHEHANEGHDHRGTLYGDLPDPARSPTPLVYGGPASDEACGNVIRKPITFAIVECPGIIREGRCTRLEDHYAR